MLFALSGRQLFCSLSHSHFLLCQQDLPCAVFSWFQSKPFHRRYCIAALLTMPRLGLCVRVSDTWHSWTADPALTCSSFLHFLCFRVLIVLVSPNLGVVPAEVLRTCSLLPLQVVWHGFYQSTFVLCCCLWHSSSGALNYDKMPVCLSTHDHSIIV